MSKDVMAACLEEAIDIWFAAMKGLHQEFDLNDSTAFVTLAVALYQERMRFPPLEGTWPGRVYADILRRNREEAGVIWNDRQAVP